MHTRRASTNTSKQNSDFSLWLIKPKLMNLTTNRCPYTRRQLIFARDRGYSFRPAGRALCMTPSRRSSTLISVPDAGFTVSLRPYRHSACCGFWRIWRWRCVQRSACRATHTCIPASPLFLNTRKVMTDAPLLWYISIDLDFLVSTFLST